MNDRVVRASGSRGTITLWLLGLGLMLLPLGGLGLDLGRAFSERRALASAADAAALAGAGAIDVAAYRADGSLVLDPAAAEQRARDSLRNQLDRSALRDARVLVEPESITVVVEGTVEFTLLRLVRGGEPFAVRVSAMARPHLRE